jgi:replicative DNA helicase Mcm
LNQLSESEQKKGSKYEYFYENYLEPDNNSNSNSALIDYEDLIQVFSNEHNNDVFQDHILEFLMKISNDIQKRPIIKGFPITHDLRDLKSSDVGKLVSFYGVIYSMQDLYPEAYKTRYHCKNCLREVEIFVPQVDLEDKSPNPSFCPECNQSSHMELIKSKSQYLDVLYIKAEEPFEDRSGSKPRNFSCIIKGDLATINSNLLLGDKVKITGVFKAITIKKGGNTKEIYGVDVFDIESIKSSYKMMEISEEDEEEIIKLSKNPKIFDNLRDSLLPDYIGNREVKEGLLCQMFSEWSNNEKRQGIHVLLVGDPGVGKSQNIMRIKSLATKSSCITGGSTTEAGLLGKNIRNEITGEWSAEAGLLPLCNEGVLCIDEFEKTNYELLNKLNQSMEQGFHTITKAAGNITFPTRTLILACMNPKNEYFDAYKSVREQIKLPNTVFDRFDLIYVLQDIPDSKKDRELVYQLTGYTESVESAISDEMFQKYVNYAKKNINPEIDIYARNVLEKHFHELRNTIDDNKTYANRDLEALIRISKSLARIELKDHVSRSHAEKAISIFEESIKTWNLKIRNPEKGIQKLEVEDLT